MPSFTLSSLAKNDLKDIARYTQKVWGREQRNIYLGMLDACFHQLAANPGMGKDCEEIREGYWKLAAGGHVIFYRKIVSDSIEVVRVLHSRMDLDTHL